MCLLENLYHHIQNAAIFAILFCIPIPVSVIAEEIYPECFPLESSWENIQFIELPDAETPIIERNSRNLGITFRKSDATVPSFYGFTYLKLDTKNIPEITNRYTLEKHFRNVKLIPLHDDLITKKGSDRLYRFTPKSKGTWVIFLVADSNTIPFLEQQGLRIFPAIERERGGTIFSGSSMKLADEVDYKACMISVSL